MAVFLKFLLPLLLLLFTIAIGFWLSRLGKPYNVILFNIHKLTALAGVIFAVIKLIQIFSTIDQLNNAIIFIIVSAACIILLFASGGLLSVGKLSYVPLKRVHNLSVAVLIITLLVMFFV